MFPASTPSLLAAAASAALLSAAAQTLPEAMAGRGRWLFLALLTGAAFFAGRALPEARLVFLPVAALGPAAFLLAVREGFDGALPALPLSLGLLGLCATAGVGAHLAPAELRGAFSTGFDALCLSLFFAAPVLVVRSLADDLNAFRRRSRVAFLSLGSLLGRGLCLAFVTASGPGALSFGGISVLALCLWMIASRPAAALREKSAPTPGLDHQEARQLERLRDVARDPGVISDPGLSLSRLSQHLKLPEHKVRRLIHVGEGAENFSAWLNAIRTERVAALLLDDTRADAAISSLAFEVGYNALSVFNRAFRARYGMSPSAFRAARGHAPQAAAAAASKPIAENDSGVRAV